MSPVPTARSRPVWAFFLFVLLAAANQVLVGAPGSEWGGFEDEPAHIVTALMIRDWMVAGWADSAVWADPRAYAESYYVHYPKVGIGQWPPVYHVGLAVWMLVFGTGKWAVLALMALWTGALAWLVAATARPMLGAVAGTLAGVALLCVPMIQLCGAAAMTEVPLAVLGLGAVLAFGRFLDSGRSCWMWGFAGLAVATILTKGSGLALSLVPPLALAMSGRWDVLRRPAFWCAGASVGLCTAPWYALTLGQTQGSWGGGSTPSWAYVRFAAGEYAHWGLALTGALGAVFAFTGVAWALTGQRRASAGAGVRAALMAWVPALLILHHVIPSSVEERHLAVLAPAWVLMGVLGAAALVRAATRWGSGSAQGTTTTAGGVWPNAVGVLTLIAGTFAWSGAPPKKSYVGWSQAGQDFIAGLVVGSKSGFVPRLLVASDPVGEGLFVAGVALSESERPNATVLRGSKVLCEAGWSGRTYAARFESPGEVAHWLTATGVGVVVLDLSTEDSRHWYRHMAQLVEVTSAADGPWRELQRWDLRRDGVLLAGTLVAFVREDWRDLAQPSLAIDDVR